MNPKIKALEAQIQQHRQSQNKVLLSERLAKYKRKYFADESRIINLTSALEMLCKAENLLYAIPDIFGSDHGHDLPLSSYIPVPKITDTMFDGIVHILNKTIDNIQSPIDIYMKVTLI